MTAQASPSLYILTPEQAREEIRLIRKWMAENSHAPGIEARVARNEMLLTNIVGSVIDLLSLVASTQGAVPTNQGDAK